MRHDYLNVNFRIEILANFEFLGVSNLLTNCSQNSTLHSHFHLKLNVEFSKKYNLKVSKQLSNNKNCPTIVSFDGFIVKALRLKQFHYYDLLSAFHWNEIDY